ncbi:hypothetical protein [Noviherbaspirillum massiliense]|uniref:hypothetical protein n=1 Tax=Noviherbaspirillum massiliense TaxID=1465823 RepID=UPI00035C5214|nr:hypothetical protein [Noviherbaspirillum massiliense]
MNKTALACSLLLSALLAACGGGGGGDGNSADNGYNPILDPGYSSAAQGFYAGTTSTGYDIKTLILEKDQYLSVYGYSQIYDLEAYGLIQGNGFANNGSYSARNLRDFDFKGAVETRSLSASYQVRSSFNGSLSDGVDTATFTSAVLPKTEYDYDMPANLGNITGGWSVTDLEGAGYALTVLTDGTLTGFSNGCSINGTIVPRSSGKNVFDVALSFGSTCSMPKTVSGVAVEYLLPGGSNRQLIIAGVTDGRDMAAALVGKRPR